MRQHLKMIYFLIACSHVFFSSICEGSIWKWQWVYFFSQNSSCCHIMSHMWLISTGIPSWLFSLFTALHDLAADVPFRFTALTHSCVVIPCSFPFQEDMPVTRGIWSKKNGDVIYHNAPSYVVDHFKGRTRILGDLNGGNCSLEIDDIKPFDNGPFCFHAERGNDRVRYNNSCVFVVMKGLD